MANEQEIIAVFGQFENEIAGFIGASLVDLESGMTLGAKSTRANFDLAAASAYNSEMVKQKLKTMKTLKLSGNLEDMLLTLTDQIHLIKMVTPQTFLYLAADRALTNLAIVRTVVNKYASALV
ncbi:MAG TPA: hypothetical protein DD490_09885 [Acidobacteria bacterium]|nr:hypothetical protein [Acidobacteriota bacterium]